MTIKQDMTLLSTTASTALFFTLTRIVIRCIRGLIRSVFLFFLLSFSYLQGNLWHVQELISHAQRLESINSFQEAIELYTLALKEIEEDPQHSSLQQALRYQLAWTYLSDQQPMLALKELEKVYPPPSYYLPLEGYAHQQLGQLQEAKDAFSTYLVKEEKEERKEDFVRWALSTLYFEEDNFKAATLTLAPLLQKKTSPYFSPALLLQAKIHTKRNQMHKALQLLSSLSEDPDSNLLKGEIYFSLNNFPEALAAYKKIEELYPNNEILYRIGWIYFLQGHLQEAQHYFEKIYTTQARALLPLTEIYLKQAETENDPKLMRRSEELLHLYLPRLLPPLQIPAQLLLARTLPHSSREEIYRSLIAEEILSHPFLMRIWMERGFYHLYVAQDNSNKNGRFDLLSKAALSFEAAEKEQPTNSEATLWRAQAYLAYHTPEKDEQAYNLLTEALGKYASQLVPPKEVEQMYSLLAYTSSLSPLPERQEQALKLWEELVEKYPKSPYALTALFAMGSRFYTLSEYEQAKTTFQKLLALDYKQKHRAKALYFISLCDEKLGLPYPLLTEQRRAIWENYPQDSCAAQAYYHTYPYALYVQGEPSVLLHLQQMARLYPRSPLSIHAHYLIGLSYLKKNEPFEAIEAFTRAADLYQTLRTAIIPEEQPYYLALSYRIELQKGWAYANSAKDAIGAKRKIYLEYAIDTFETLAQKESKESEEALFALGQIYRLSYQNERAQQMFDRLLQSFQTQRITRGYILARTLFEKALLAKEEKDYVLASSYLQQAEDAAQGKVLSGEERILLWIEWGLSQMELTHYDEALWLFSRAANEHVISEQRLKALFLRAQVYERQGREELARRQLHSLAKMEGEWAQQAQEKLRNLQ